MSWRAFDKTVRRKPLAFAADAVYGNSIDLELEVIAKKEVARKALLLMFVDVLLLAFTPMIVRRGSSSFKRRHLHPYTRQRPPRKRLRSDGTLGNQPAVSKAVATERAKTSGYRRLEAGCGQDCLPRVVPKKVILATSRRCHKSDCAPKGTNGSSRQSNSRIPSSLPRRPPRNA